MAWDTVHMLKIVNTTWNLPDLFCKIRSRAVILTKYADN